MKTDWNQRYNTHIKERPTSTKRKDGTMVNKSTKKQATTKVDREERVNLRENEKKKVKEAEMKGGQVKTKRKKNP
jgi:hypothetical protein